MKKIFSFAILAVMMASMVVFTSCGSDDDPVEEVKPTKTWVEPYHVKGASVEEVQAYMASHLGNLTKTEQVSANCLQLMYSDRKSGAGVVYSFTLDDELYSVIDTEPTDMKQVILERLFNDYSLVSEQSGAYVFTTADKNTIISLLPVNDRYIYVNYDFVIH
ncbi:MAG: hypothetical protein Q4B58_05650 [Bacteroidales bacterium]|nr:hypothetical protein [Bacteroidales bacterium]